LSVLPILPYTLYIYNSYALDAWQVCKINMQIPLNPRRSFDTLRPSRAEIPDIGATNKPLDTAGWVNSMSVLGG